jgi:ketosteroid isomerase-like protein
LELNEENAVFPNHRTTAQGPEQIRAVLQGHVDSGAKLEIDRHVAFESGDIALVQNAWTMTKVNGDTATGVTVEIARKQSDGLWTYVTDSPDGAALIKT